MEGDRFRKLGGFLRGIFGARVFKVGLRGGFTCPNRDGTAGAGGCSFCNPDSSMPLGYRDGIPLREQLREGCAYVARRHGAVFFIAYFQDYSTTYGDVDRLRELLLESLSFPGVVGAALCTRPDCLGDAVLEMLSELAKEHFLWVEIGVQSSEDGVLLRANRCHDAACSAEAFRILHGRGLLTAAHMIIGLPGFTSGSIRADAAFVRESGTAGIKLQNLHVVAGTRLGEEFLSGAFEPMTYDAYTSGVVEFLELTDPAVVVQRVSGEAPRGLTIAPDWSVNKLAVVNAVQRRMEETDTWQGRALGFPRSALAGPPVALSAIPRNLADIALKRLRE
jgi:radical SAM protein (TIGR01212 family)